MSIAKNSHRRQRFYTWLLIVNIIFLGMITTGCKNKKPIKVGFVGCLTGRLSDLGLSGRNSAMLAIEQINKSGGIHGRQVEFLAKDNQLDPTKLKISKAARFSKISRNCMFQDRPPFS